MDTALWEAIDLSHPPATRLSCRGSYFENKPCVFHYKYLLYVHGSRAFGKLSYRVWWWLSQNCNAPPRRGLVYCVPLMLLLLLLVSYVFACVQQHRCPSEYLLSTHRRPSRDHCAARVTRWGWRRRLPRSMATQLQQSSAKWLTKASLRTLFMKTRGYIWNLIYTC